MRGFFNGLILGMILGAFGFWYVQKKALQHPEEQQRYEEAMAKMHVAMSEAAKNTTDAMSAKLDTLDLHGDEIKAELAKKGEIIRRKARDIGDTGVGTDSDNHAMAEIKGKYAVDSTLASRNISVNCAQGHVTLIGTVATADDIGRAVTIALDSDGVRDVTSTLQVKPNP